MNEENDENKRETILNFNHECSQTRLNIHNDNNTNKPKSQRHSHSIINTTLARHNQLPTMMSTAPPGGAAAAAPSDDGKLVNLLERMEKSECYAKNEHSHFPMTNLFIGDSRLGCKSDADEQLIIHISFQEFVKVRIVEFADGDELLLLQREWVRCCMLLFFSRTSKSLEAKIVVPHPSPFTNPFLIQSPQNTQYTATQFIIVGPFPQIHWLQSRPQSGRKPLPHSLVREPGKLGL